MATAHKKIREILHGNDSQKGVTLLLAILILVAIAVVVFSVAAVAINEIRSSGDLAKTEPAIQAADAVAEDTIYASMRGINQSSYNTNCSSPVISTQSTTGVRVSTCLNPYLVDPYTFAVPTQIGSVVGEKDYYVYNPNTADPTNNPGYTQLVFKMLNGSSSVSVKVCIWSDTNCVGNATPYQSGVVSLGSTWTVNLSASSAYQLVLLNTSATSSPTIQMTSYQSSVLQGLPSAQTVIITTGSNGGVTRKIQSQVGE